MTDSRQCAYAQQGGPCITNSWVPRSRWCDACGGTEFACTVRSGRFYAKGRSERDLAHAAMERALDHLQQLNGGKP